MQIPQKAKRLDPDPDILLDLDPDSLNKDPKQLLVGIEPEQTAPTE
jgi:hypothetical protein